MYCADHPQIFLEQNTDSVLHQGHNSLAAEAVQWYTEKNKTIVIKIIKAFLCFYHIVFIVHSIYQCLWVTSLLCTFVLFSIT